MQGEVHALHRVYVHVLKGLGVNLAKLNAMEGLKMLVMGMESARILGCVYAGVCVYVYVCVCASQNACNGYGECQDTGWCVCRCVCVYCAYVLRNGYGECLEAGCVCRCVCVCVCVCVCFADG